jgi:hypothetical protein
MKVVDQRKDSFRRRFHRGCALHAEHIRLGRGEDEHDCNHDGEHDGDDGDDLEHKSLRYHV